MITSIKAAAAATAIDSSAQLSPAPRRAVPRSRSSDRPLRLASSHIRYRDVLVALCIQHCSQQSATSTTDSCVTGTKLLEYNNNNNNNNNILVLQQNTFFSQLRSRLSAQLMSRPLTFSHFWPRKLVITPATSERQLFLFQRVSVLVQRFNSVLLHDSFVFEDCPE